MQLELTKNHLVDMVMGTCGPNFSIMDELRILGVGYWTGGFVDKWTWNKSILQKLSEETLYNIYKKVKESWNERI
jgi:hypothetical protein